MEQAKEKCLVEALHELEEEGALTLVEIGGCSTMVENRLMSQGLLSSILSSM